MASEQTQYDLPIVVGAAVFGLIAIGVFFFMRKDPVLPAQPAEPVRTPVVAQPVAPTMVETSGPAGNNQQGAGGTVGGGSRAGGGATGGGGSEAPAVAGSAGIG
jgi:uncharacterized membrane protein YgcG